MPSRRELGTNESTHVGRPVQEPEGEDKFQLMAEATRRCPWGGRIVRNEVKGPFQMTMCKIRNH